MERSRLKRSQWIAILAGPILAVLSFVVTYYVDPLRFGQHTPLAAVPAFLLSVVVLLIGHNLAALQEIEKASAYSDRIYEAVRDYLHVTKVGSPAAAFEYVLAWLLVVASPWRARGSRRGFRLPEAASHRAVRAPRRSLERRRQRQSRPRSAEPPRTG